MFSIDLIIENLFYFLGSFLFSIISTFLIILILLLINKFDEITNEDWKMGLVGTISLLFGVLFLIGALQNWTWDMIYIIPISTIILGVALVIAGALLFFISRHFYDHKISGGIILFVLISGVMVITSLRLIDGFYLNNDSINIFKQAGVYFLCFEFMLVLLIIPILLIYLVLKIIQDIAK